MDPHRLLVKLVPGGAKKALTARQARVLLADVPAGDVVREQLLPERRQLRRVRGVQGNPAQPQRHAITLPAPVTSQWPSESAEPIRSAGESGVPEQAVGRAFDGCPRPGSADGHRKGPMPMSVQGKIIRSGTVAFSDVRRS
jgi:hypothetical protein